MVSAEWLSTVRSAQGEIILYMPGVISTGGFCVNIDSDDDDHKPSVSGDARRAQEEANDNAAAQEKEGGTEDDPEDDDMGAQEETSGYVSEEEDNEWNYRDNDMAARDIINSQRMAICMDEPREAHYMAGFIALQMSRLWGMFKAGEKKANDAALEGIASCPYRSNLGHYPNITEVDRDGIILPSTEHKISQSHNVRTRTYRTIGERTQYIRYLALKCEGLHVFYKLWVAAKILNVTRDEMKLLVSDASIHWGTSSTDASPWRSTANIYPSRGRSRAASRPCTVLGATSTPGNKKKGGELSHR